jgi:hypothetical protein
MSKHVGRGGLSDKDSTSSWVNSTEYSGKNERRQRQTIPLITLKRLSFRNNWTKSAIWDHLEGDQKVNSVKLRDM